MAVMWAAFSYLLACKTKNQCLGGEHSVPLLVPGLFSGSFEEA